MDVNITIDQLLQIFNGTTWDGDLISKQERDSLVDGGLVDRHMGYNFITKKGIEYLLHLHLVSPGKRITK